MPILPLLLLGFALGIRHATDPDHVIAVSTIVAKERRVGAAAAVGAMWGLGHTLTVLLLGGAIILFDLVIPPRIGLTLELGVAVMLVVLGFATVAGRRSASSSTARPLAIGVVHGLAGSAAVALLVVAAVHHAVAGVAYLLLFSLGTVLGMTAMTSAMSLPFARATGVSERANRWLAQGTGVMSVLFGLFMAYQVGVIDGLFSGHPQWSPH